MSHSLNIGLLALLALSHEAQASVEPGAAPVPQTPVPAGPNNAPTAAEAGPTATPNEPGAMPIALGLGLGYQRRQDYGSLTRSHLLPELLGLTYRPAFGPRVYWRIGGRLGFAGLEQAEYPQGLSVVERDFRLSGEAGLVYESLVVPSITAGLGLQYRQIKFRSSIPGVEASSLDDSEVQPFGFLQAGAGVPIADGLLLIEPYLRYERIRRDDRSQWMMGLDVSVEIR